MTAPAMEGPTLSADRFAVSAPSVTIPHKLNSSGGYAAGDSSDRRRSAQVKNGREESILTQTRRNQLTANSRDLVRNFEVVPWAIRRHLDYVCDFEFDCSHADKGFQNQFEAFVDNWSLEENFEISGRFTREQWIRLVEAAAIADGDILVVKLATGKIQAIEGDRIRNDGGADFAEGKEKGTAYWQGVKVDEYGRALAYKINRRTNASSFEFEREIKAENARLYAHSPRFDSIRGVSPIAASLNTFRDVYDNKDLALAKSKLTNIMGVKFKRSGEYGPLPTEKQNDGTYTVDYSGPFQVDLNPGDDMDIVNTDSPGTNFQDFMIQMLQLALKALDIPFSFYNESFTNFFGSRAAWHHYERSCTPKRNRVKSLLTWLTLWKVGLAIDDGEFDLPSGMSFEEVRKSINWIPKGMPWWKPSEEINGDLAAIAGGLTSPQRVTKSRGQGDAFRIAKERAEYEAYCKELGVTVSYGGFIPPPLDPTENQTTTSGAQTE